MRSFHSPVKDTAYLFYRLFNPIIDPINFFIGIIGYPRFIKELVQYKLRDPHAKIVFSDLYPIVKERTSLTPFDGHYYFQSIWLLKNVLKNKPNRHVDIASTYQLSGYISLITKSEFVDLRPIETKLKNLRIVRGDVLNLPYADSSLSSVSSLHVIEHIGLGRYGDKINPKGTIEACNELCRIVKPGGYLYISLPVGKRRICFNAHRVHHPNDIPRYCKSLKLIEFSVVDDHGRYLENQKTIKYANQSYACGMYVFKKR